MIFFFFKEKSLFLKIKFDNAFCCVDYISLNQNMGVRISSTISTFS